MYSGIWHTLGVLFELKKEQQRHITLLYFTPRHNAILREGAYCRSKEYEDKKAGEGILPFQTCSD